MRQEVSEGERESPRLRRKKRVKLLFRCAFEAVQAVLTKSLMFFFLSSFLPFLPPSFFLYTSFPISLFLFFSPSLLPSLSFFQPSLLCARFCSLCFFFWLRRSPKQILLHKFEIVLVLRVAILHVDYCRQRHS